MVKTWLRKKLIAKSENSSWLFWQKILSFLDDAYLFLVFYWRIAKTNVMLHKLDLKKTQLPLPLATINKLNFDESPLRITNPSLVLKRNALYGVARITNGYYEHVADYAGRPIQKHRIRNERLIDGIVSFKTDISGHVSSFETIHAPSTIPNYQDPRIFKFKNHFYIVMTRMLEEKHYGVGRFRSGISLQMLGSNRIIHLNSPLNNGIEKNWIPILNDDSIKLLYSSNPISIIEIDNLDSRYKFHKTNHMSALNLNNRSQMVRVRHARFSYIRVASKKFANFRYGYTPFHYFELLSAEFKPLALSRPFVFSRIQMEICNSLVLDGETLILAWTENEETNMIGTLPIQSIFSMFSSDFDR